MYNQLSNLDRRLLKLLLESEGAIPTHELSRQLDVPISTVQRRRNRLEEEYILKQYSLNPLKLGYRRIDLLIYTRGGETMEVARALMKRNEVTFAARTIGEHTIDLRIEVFVKDNAILLNLLEEVKAMSGVRDVVWTEVVEEIVRKSPPDPFEV
jgi:DNA-binding Lrp family transcriptional regulator